MSSEICTQTINAGGCLVLAPGLLSRVPGLRETEPLLVGNLARLLSHADQIALPETERLSAEVLVASVLLPHQPGLWPGSGAAYFTCRSDYPDAVHTTSTVMRADPVYQQIDMNNATLGNPLELELTLAECTALQETLNQHFAEDGIRFKCVDPYRWYCQFDSPLQVTTIPTSAAIGCDVASVKPTGTDARRWRSKLAEIEMLLFEHPVNTARQQNNKLPVNTLWLWGEGHLSSAASQGAASQVSVSQVPVDSVQNVSIYSDNFYTRSINDYLGLQHNELPDAATAIKSVGDPTLIVIDKFTRPDARQPSQHDTLQWFDEIIGDQLWHGLRAKGWPQITLWLGDNRLFRVQASAKKQWWRRLLKKTKPLSAFLPESEISMVESAMVESSMAESTHPAPQASQPRG